MNTKLVVDGDSLKSFEGDTSTLTKELYRFLREHSRPILDSIFGGDFYPVRTLVSIRTDYTNEIVVPDNGTFYTDCTKSHSSYHPIDDAVMLAAKSLIDCLFDCGQYLPSVIQRTALYPLGAFVMNDVIYVYANVVIDYSLKDYGEIFRLHKSHFESIESISPTSPLEEELLKHLVVVKGENRDA